MTVEPVYVKNAIKRIVKIFTEITLNTSRNIRKKIELPSCSNKENATFYTDPMKEEKAISGVQEYAFSAAK